MSDLVNEAVKPALTEDLEDLSPFEERAEEPNLPLERVLKDLIPSTKRASRSCARAGPRFIC